MTSFRPALALLLCLLIGGAGLTGCRTTTPAAATPAAPAAASPEVSREYQIRQSLLSALAVVEATQNSASALYHEGKLSKEKTKLTVTWTVASAKAIKAATVAMSSTRPLAEKIAAVKSALGSIGYAPAISEAASLLGSAESAISAIWRLL